MKLARWIYLVAGLYGLVVLTPMLFAGPTMPDGDPAAPYAAFFYGFAGTALVWQLAFLLIATDPARYRLLMLVTIGEKIAFFAPGLALYLAGRMSQGPLFYGSLIDGALMIAFAIAWWSTRAR